jgi:hypothetical protein
VKVHCPHKSRTKASNNLYWEGNSPEVLVLGPTSCTPTKCTIVCRFCKSTLVCLKLCSCKMFYIIPKNYNMSRVAIHIGFHDHLVADGDCKEALELIRNQIFAQVAKTPDAKNSAIGLAVGKELLLKGLLDESCNGRKLSEGELEQVFDRWSKLGSHMVRNLISEARRFYGQGGYIDKILKLKESSIYDYIHNSVFPRQGIDLVYLFKMSTCGPASGVSLVR